MIKKLNDLKINESGKIEDIVGNNKIKFLQIGFTKGTLITMKTKSPFDGPIDIIMRNSHLVMRKEEAEHILINII